MAELIQDMQSKWRISDKGKKSSSDNEVNETALANAGSDKRTSNKKKCYHCNQRGTGASHQRLPVAKQERRRRRKEQRRI